MGIQNFLIVNWNYYQASDFCIGPDLNLSDYEDVINLSLFVCSIEDKFGTIQTTIIFDASEGVSRYISVVPRESKEIGPPRCQLSAIACFVPP